MNSKLSLHDVERGTTLGLTDNAVYALPACELAYGELVATDEPVTEPSPQALDRDVRAKVGFADDGQDNPRHVPAALAEASIMRKAGPAPTSLGTFFGVEAAHEEAVIDLLRHWGVPYDTIDSWLGHKVDSSVRRLLEPGAKARELDAIDAATKAEDARAAAVMKARDEAGKQIHDGPCPPGECWFTVKEEYLPKDRRPDAPAYVDEDGNHFYRQALLKGMQCGFPSRRDRGVIRPGDLLPIPRSALNAPLAPMNSEKYEENQKGLKRLLKGQPARPAPVQSLRHRDIGQALLAEHGHRLVMGFHTSYGIFTLAYVIAAYRDLGLPLLAFVQDEAAAMNTQGKGTRPFTAIDTATVQDAAVRIYQDLSPEGFIDLIPKGIVDHVKEKAASWGVTLRRFLTGKTQATSAELVAHLKESGLDADESRSQDHQAIRDALGIDWTKRRITNENGERQNAFVRSE